VQIVAWLMASMYIGSATGSAIGTTLLGAGTSAALLPAWALTAGGGGLVTACVLAILLHQRDTASRRGTI
jgi:hypothetical protein